MLQPREQTQAQPANTSGQISPRHFSESEVRKIQQAHDDKGFKSGKVDGSWGRETEAAFKDFHKGRCCRQLVRSIRFPLRY